MLTATQNAVGLKDISVSKVSVKGADGQLVIMINLDEAAAFELLLLCLFLPVCCGTEKISGQ